MQTRAKTKMAVEYIRFERTVNLLLLVALKDLPAGTKLTLDGHPEQFVEMSQILEVPKPGPMQKKLRHDGAFSQPDAVITFPYDDRKMPIVIDAKHYTTDVSAGTIRKTLDDMALRDTPFGLLVCSEIAGLSSYNFMIQTQLDGASQQST